MKFTLLLSILIVTLSCHTKQHENKTAEDSSDSTDLMMPKAEEMAPKATATDHEHCVDLTGGQFLLVVKGQRHVATDLKSLGDSIDAYQNEIKGRTLNIITDNAVSYKTTVDVLDLMVINHIGDYKLKEEQ